MTPLLEGFLGALVGGSFALAGSWIVARKAFKSTQVTEQRALLSETRSRLVTLYAPVMSLAWALEGIVHDQMMLWGDDTVEKKRERHNHLLAERRNEMSKVSALLAMEASSGALEGTLAELWKTFNIHMTNLDAMPASQYPVTQQRDAVDKVSELVNALGGMMKRNIVELDLQAEQIVGLGAPKSWPHFLGTRKSVLSDRGPC